MSDKTDNSRFSPTGIDTLIGAEMSVHGDIACSGTLRVQGTLVGNVSCDGAPDATLVVDGAGNVSGTVHVARLFVRGRIAGPVSSTQSIEIHPGGSVVGDVSFKALAIHSGGVVEGLMIPLPTATAERAMADRLPLAAAAGGVFAGRGGGARRTASAAALAVAVIAVAWGGSTYLQSTGPAGVASPQPERAASDAAGRQPPSLPAGEPRTAPAAESGEAAPLASSPSVAAAPPAPAAAADRRGLVEQNVVTVTGANPSRPAGVFLLISNEPAVLYRKKRDEPGEGDRIATAQGERVSVSVAPGELVRVARGQDVTILYQGQKVSRQILDGGSWISFVPK